VAKNGRVGVHVLVGIAVVEEVEDDTTRTIAEVGVQAVGQENDQRTDLEVRVRKGRAYEYCR